MPGRRPGTGGAGSYPHLGEIIRQRKICVVFSSAQDVVELPLMQAVGVDLLVMQPRGTDKLMWFVAEADLVAQPMIGGKWLVLGEPRGECARRDSESIAFLDTVKDPSLAPNTPLRGIWGLSRGFSRSGVLCMHTAHRFSGGMDGLAPCGYACRCYRARPQNIHHILQPVCVDTDYIVRQENLLP